MLVWIKKKKNVAVKCIWYLILGFIVWYTLGKKNPVQRHMDKKTKQKNAVKPEHEMCVSDE